MWEFAWGPELLDAKEWLRKACALLPSLPPAPPGHGLEGPRRATHRTHELAMIFARAQGRLPRLTCALPLSAQE